MTECYILVEASSSKIGFTGFKSKNGKIQHIKINGKNNILLKGTKIVRWIIHHLLKSLLIPSYLKE